MKKLSNIYRLFSTFKKLRTVNRELKTKRGFTLIEMIVYFGIFSILLVVITSFFTSSISTQLESESLTSIEQDSRYLLLKLSKDIGEATSITIPATVGASSSAMRLVINGQNHDYAVQNNNLTLTNNSGTFNLNNFNTNIASFSAVRRGNINGKNTITVDFMITSKVQQASGFETKSFNATFGTR